MSAGGRTWVIIRDPEEAARASKMGFEKPVYLCTRYDAFVHCRDRFSEVVLLDEALVKTEYSRANRWVYEQLTILSQLFFNDSEKTLFLECRAYDIRSLFLRCLKQVLTLEKHINVSGRIYIFERPDSLLIKVLKEYFLRVYSSLEVTVLPGVSRRSAKELGWGFKALFYRALAVVLNSFTRKAIQRMKWKQKLVLASGSLAHLGPVVASLARRAQPVVYGEPEFNLAKFLFCLRHRIFFYIFKRHHLAENPLSGNLPFGSAQPLHYGERDLAPLLNTVLSTLHETGSFVPYMDRKEVSGFFKRHRIGWALLDEDYALRRVFSITARECGTESVVISHGVPSILILGKERETDAPAYYSGITLVQSDYEKEAYERICYLPSRVVVTGAPRYDRLHAIRQRRRGSNNASKKTVLFCGSIMTPYDFEGASSISSLLGQRSYSLEILGEGLKDAIRVCGSREDIRLWIKPHYHQPALWKSLLRDAGAGKNCRLFSSSEDIFELEAVSDLIITPVSSVICEALMLEKPVLILNYGCDQELVAPYVDRGAGIAVSNRAEMESALFNLLFNKKGRQQLFEQGALHRKELAGELDGRSTARVVECVTGMDR